MLTTWALLTEEDDAAVVQAREVLERIAAEITAFALDEYNHAAGA